MSVSRDSIQTLLHQRRQLRDCLKELKTEISSLNDKASAMSDEDFKSGEMKVQDTATFNAPIMKNAPSLPKREIRPSEREEKASIGDLVANGKVKVEPVTQEDPLPEQEPELELEPEQRQEHLTAAETVLAPRAAKQHEPSISDSASSKSEIETRGRAEELPPPMAEETSKNLEETLHHAILLAGFFLHHPSAAGNQLLTKLDTAIQQTQNLPEGENKNQAVAALKDAYRNVLDRTYMQNKVTGETLDCSQQSNPYLFGVPLSIAALIMVAMPALLLLKVLAEQTLHPTIISDFEILIRGIMAFVWGCVGGLSYIALMITKLVRRGAYEPRLVNGIGVTWALGGLCGVISFIILQYMGVPGGMIIDYAQGIGAFLLGLIAGKIVNMVIGRNSTARQKPLKR